MADRDGATDLRVALPTVGRWPDTLRRHGGLLDDHLPAALTCFPISEVAMHFGDTDVKVADVESRERDATRRRATVETSGAQARRIRPMITSRTMAPIIA